MFRPIGFCLLLFVLAISPPAPADVTYTETDARTADSVTVIRMTVTPAAEPIPALKHRFVARDIDLTAGNAVPYYYRALLDSALVMKRIREKFGDDDEELGRWYGTGADATPIDELPLERVREASGMLVSVIDNHLADAVARRDCDWELGLEELRGIEVIQYLLPEFQQSRDLARMVALRTRLAIAERRYEDAIDNMRMNYRLGGDVAKPPLLVCGLIGFAIESVANGTLMELIAAPDSPNLYWALTDLPDPPADLRPAARFELDFGPRMFPFIHHAETTERADEEWNRLFTEAFRDLQKAGGAAALFGAAPVEESDAAAGLVATAAGLLGYSHAKQQLVAWGMDRGRVESMAVGQVMAIYTERNYRHFADAYETLWYMPFWEMQKRGSPVNDELSDAGMLSGNENRELMPMVSILLPAMQAARAAQMRLERDVAALRVIEALRMYAAAHNGRLPVSLDEIDQVPVPMNPATGKPFEYRVDGTTAILELPASDGIRGYGRRFEIQIAGDKQ